MANKKTDKHTEQGVNSYMALVVVGVVLVVLICGFVANSLVHSLILNTKVISAKNKVKSQLDTKVANAPQLVDAYHNLGNGKLLVLDALPTSPEYDDLVVVADNLTASSGVTLKTISPASDAGSVSSTGATSTTPTVTSTTSTASAPSPAAAPQPQAYAFSMSVEGQYNNIYNFIKSIEQSSRMIKVTSVTFTSSGTVVDADIQLETYYQDKANVTEGTEVIK